MTNEEIKKEILHRVAVQKKKRQRVLRVSASVGCAAVVALTGVGLVRGGVFDQTPPVTDKVVKPTTTETTAPTEQDVTTTTANTPATETTTVTTTPTQTTTVTTVAPTTTAKPTTGKTEPPKTTATTTTAVKEKLLITGDGPDNYTADESALKFISPALLAKMEEYKDADVKYALKVTIPITSRDLTLKNDFWTSTEELVQYNKELEDAENAFFEEAKQLNPAWDGLKTQDIEVWTDSLRAKYERWYELVYKRNDLMKQYQGPYVEAQLNKRYETLKSLCDEEPSDIECVEFKSLNTFYHSYYVELTADAIEALAKQSGYYIFFADADYGWIMDE